MKPRLTNKLISLICLLAMTVSLFPITCFGAEAAKVENDYTGPDNFSQRLNSGASRLNAGSSQPADKGSVSNGVISLTVRVQDSVSGAAANDLISNLKKSFTAASEYLYNATKKQTRFGQITIIVPPKDTNGWPQIQDAAPVGNLNPDKADVFVRPGSGASANPGGFMQDNNTHIFLGQDETNNPSSCGRTIVHEFGHYGFDLGDEYCDYQTIAGVYSQVFKDANGRWNKCTNGVTWEITPNVIPSAQYGSITKMSVYSNGQPASIMWVQHLASVVDFCYENHNKTSLTDQNIKHSFESTWETMVKSTKGFNLNYPGSPKIKTISNDTPTFKVLQAKSNSWSDVELVIDRSGSMGSENKMEMAKGAAKQFVDMLDLPTQGQDGEAIGIVSYDDNFTVELSIYNVENAGDKQYIKSKINPLYARGMTSIGGGLQTALSDLNAAGRTDIPDAIILLTDGMQNTPPRPEDVLPAITAKQIPVYTIGLGSDAEQTRLQWIAGETGGQYYFSPSASDMGLIYKTIKGKLGTSSSFVNFFSFELAGKEKLTKTVPVDASMTTAKFTLDGSNIADVDFSLIAPDGTVYDSIYTNGADYIDGGTYKLFVVSNPAPGNWQMFADNKGDDQQTVAMDLSGATTLRIQGGTDAGSYDASQPVKITALLQGTNEPIRGAEVKATVTGPKGKEVTVLLNDDGIMGDDVPGDGYYTGYFSDFMGDGTYQAVLSANNAAGSAIEGVAFRDFGLNADGSLQQSSECPITENFSRRLLLPSFTVSGSQQGDIIPPGKVDTLKLDSVTDQNVLLSWKSVGDDGYSGQAAVYEMVYAIKPIVTVTDWAYSSKLANLPVPKIAGADENYITGKLPLGNYYFALAVIDEAGNRSPISNNTYVEIKELPETPSHGGGGSSGNTAPTVNSTNPVNGAVGVPVDTDITVHFSETIQKGSEFSKIVLKKADGSAVDAAVDISPTDGKVLTIKPNNNLLADTNYVATIPTNAIKDYSGTTLAKTCSISFTTGKFGKAGPFTDIKDNYWAANEIFSLYNKGIVTGFPDATFRPRNQVRRAELAIMAAKALKLDTASADLPQQFSDVAANHWAYKEIEALAKANVMVGFNGKFRPDASITREELVQVIVNCLHYGQTSANSVPTDVLNQFTDLNKIPLWARNAVAEAVAAGIVKGVDSNKFGAGTNANREQAAVLVDKALKLREAK